MQILSNKSILTIITLTIASCLILSSANTAYAFFDFGGWEKKYNQIMIENDELKSEISKLESEISKLLKLYDKQSDKINILNNDISSLEDNATDWRAQALDYQDKLKISNDKITQQNASYNQLSDDYNSMSVLYDSQIKDYIEQVTKPRIEIKHTKMTWIFSDSKGNSYGVVWPVKTYEDIKSYSENKSLTQEHLSLTVNEKTITTVNLDGFVKGYTFDCCIDQLYENSESNEDFIWEVWNIVSQMTIYDEDLDLESEGRFAIETVHRGGGDCEDLVILIAELLKSSSHTKDWTIQYVFMDSKNIKNPKTVDHIALHVNDGVESYYIESTIDADLDYYPDGITGWYFDV